MNILRVDMEKSQVRWEPVSDAYKFLGGRALSAKVLLDEVPATCDPLGPHNKLIFAPGLLGGAGVTTAGRLSIGAKSPLTGGVKEANAGGTAGDTLGRMGIKAIVVETLDELLHQIYRFCYGTRSVEKASARAIGHPPPRIIGSALPMPPPISLRKTERILLEWRLGYPPP